MGARARSMILIIASVSLNAPKLAVFEPQDNTPPEEHNTSSIHVPSPRFSIFRSPLPRPCFFFRNCLTSPALALKRTSSTPGSAITSTARAVSKLHHVLPCSSTSDTSEASAWCLLPDTRARQCAESAATNTSPAGHTARKCGGATCASQVPSSLETGTGAESEYGGTCGADSQ